MLNTGRWINKWIRFKGGN